jgi:geranylgeranyl diphosphate synthase, type I
LTGVAGTAVDFREALKSRRDLVYGYLESWPGIPSFRPEHMQRAIMSYVQQRGKGLRPALLLLSCGAMGGDEEQAVPAAAAVEIFHIWTLVHDDFIDRDATRRGSPTVHAEFGDLAVSQSGLSKQDASHYGASVAILAGDLQQSWSYGLLCELADRGVPAELVVELVRRMGMRLTPQLMEGEMLDVQYSLPNSRAGGGVAGVDASVPSSAEILEMLEKKTGALLEYAAWAGARIGAARSGMDPVLADRVADFARLAGLAFQLHDDVLGITADERELGKPVGSDIREGKQTYLVSLTIERAERKEREALLAALGNRSATPTQVADAVGAIQAAGALEDTTRLANSYIDTALRWLESLPASVQRDLLRDWAHYLLARTY